MILILLYLPHFSDNSSFQSKDSLFIFFIPPAFKHLFPSPILQHEQHIAQLSWSLSRNFQFQTKILHTYIWIKSPLPSCICSFSRFTFSAICFSLRFLRFFLIATIPRTNVIITAMHDTTTIPNIEHIAEITVQTAVILKKICSCSLSSNVLFTWTLDVSMPALCPSGQHVICSDLACFYELFSVIMLWYYRHIFITARPFISWIETILRVHAYLNIRALPW